ncbi:hypothetical protein DH2020_032924 [Rehmannia glutinosa]|uniref:Uncharacterized protein n=1 Tax=Rehmannia glutinosa TaxID=99300 RepID=A0ABR0VFJ5_REHGL
MEGPVSNLLARWLRAHTRSPRTKGLALREPAGRLAHPAHLQRREMRHQLGRVRPAVAVPPQELRDGADKPGPDQAVRLDPKLGHGKPHEAAPSRGFQAGYVEVMKNCRLTICSILICLCFGVKISEDRIKVIESVLKDVMLMTAPQLPDFLPVLTPLFRRQVKKAKELRRKQLECLVPLIRNRKAFVESGGNLRAAEEMASPLGAAYVDSLFELEAPGKGKLGEEEIVTLCSEAINAGTDTSATTVEWALLHLVQNQEIQEKLYKEIVGCVGVNGVVTESDVEKMAYLATEDIELGGYTIPADAYVEFYTAWLTEDPEMWQNPERIPAERFLNG